MGRPPHQPTDETRARVHALASFGVPQDDIAQHIGLSLKTLTKHYRAELDRAELDVNKEVAGFLYTAASGKALTEFEDAKFSDCVRAAMFWAKTRMKWSEQIDVGGAGGGPVEVAVTHRIIRANAESDA